MRSRGWAGSRPASDEEAIGRILDAVDAAVAEGGPSVRVADVARALGITRQTVYRYFPNAGALLVASATRATNGFIDQAVERVQGIGDPVTAVVDFACWTIETLAGHPQLDNLASRRDGEAITSLASVTAIAFCLSCFHRFDVDWKLHGFDDAALTEVAEITLRTVQSILTDPGRPSRESPALRRFVSRWLGPVILYPRMASVRAYQESLTSPGLHTKNARLPTSVGHAT